MVYNAYCYVEMISAKLISLPLSMQFTYNQLALTQETDRDSLSHLPAYPPYTQFFVEPKEVATAIKCRIKLLSSDGREICYLRVIPFSGPKRGDL